MFLLVIMGICIENLVLKANPLSEVDLASDTAWTLSIDGGTPRAVKVPGGGWNSNIQNPVIDRWYGVNEYVIYQRNITIPNHNPSQVTKVLFGAVNFGAEIYLNDTLITTHHGPMMPFEADLTGYVTPGNTYTLKVKAFHKRWYLNRYGSQCPVPIGFDFQTGTPPVSGYNAKFAYGITKYVKLTVYPPQYLKDIFVRPSVTNNNLYFDLWVENHAATSKSLTVQGNFSSWNGDAWSYPAISDTNFNVPAHTTQKVTVGPVTWGLGSGSYWWPNIPFRETYTAKLHNLNLTLKEGANVLETRTQRFGFSEYTEGPNYYKINGIRVNHISDGTPESAMSYYDCYSTAPAFLPPSGPNTGAPETWKRYMRIGINTNRIHQSTPTEYMMNAADEVGFMMVPETAIRGYDSNWQLWHDTYLPQAVKELARVCRNHPCVVRYSLSNETPVWTPLIEAIVTEDNTRPLVYETHPAHNQPERINSANGHAYTMNHYTTYPKPATIISGMGEFAWGTDEMATFAVTGKDMRKNDLSYFAGWDWLNYWPNFLEGMSHAQHAWTPNNHADRTDGVDGWNSPLINFVQRSFHPFLVMDLDIEANNANYVSNWPANVPSYNSGQTITRNIEVFNGGLSGNTMSLQWEARWDSPNGALATSGLISNFNLEPGFHTVRTVSFTAPTAGTADRSLFIVMKSVKDSTEVYKEDRIYVKVSDGGTSITSVNDNTTGTANNQFEYVGSWSYSSQPNAYQNDNHYSLTTNAYFQVRFFGTQIKWYGCKAPNAGIGAVSIDGSSETNADQYTGTRSDNVVLYTSPALTRGQHILKVRVTGTKNGSASDFYITADRVDIIDNVATTPIPTVTPTPTPTSTPTPTVTPASGGTVTVNDNVTGTGNNQFEYVGIWDYFDLQTGCYLNDNHFSKTANAYFQVRFYGTQIKWYGCKAPNTGIGAVSIDGGPETNIDQYATSRSDNLVLYTSPALTLGQHTLKVRVTGTKNSSASDYWVTADRVDIIDQVNTSASYIGMDTTTQGNWGGIYGADGYVLCNYNGGGSDVRSLPSYVSSITYAGPLNWVWNGSTTETRVLAPNSSNSGIRKAACYYTDTGGYFTVTINVNDANTHNLALYCLDYVDGPRVQTIDLLDPVNDTELYTTQTVSSFGNGTYVKYSFKGSIKIKITKTGGPNGVISGIFFD